MNETGHDKSGSIPVRYDKRFGRQHMLRNVVLAIPPVIIFAVLWQRGEETDSTTWLLSGFFVLWIAGWILADVFYFKRYRCPACGATIRQPTIVSRKPGDPIRYYCRKCEVEWDTRLRESGEI